VGLEFGSSFACIPTILVIPLLLRRIYIDDDGYVRVGSKTNPGNGEAILAMKKRPTLLSGR
jgi:hypothetical protein